MPPNSSSLSFLTEKSLRYVLVGTVVVVIALIVGMFVLRPDPEAVGQRGIVDEQPVDSLVNLESILGYSEDYRDSIIVNLRDVSLRADQSDRSIALWYADRKNWKPYFGNVQVLDRYIVREVKRLIAAGEMDPAIRLLLTLGRINGSSGDWSRTAARGQWAAALAREAANENATGWAVMQIGVAYTFVRDSIDAMPNLRQAIDIARETEDLPLFVTALVNIGAVHWRVNQMDSATYYNRLAFEAVSPRERPNLYAYALTDYAMSLVIAGDCTQARELLHPYLEQYLVSADPITIKVYRTLMHCAAYEDNDEALAEEYLDRLCSVAAALGNTDSEATCLMLRARIAEHFDRDKESLAGYKDYLTHLEDKADAAERRNVALAEASQHSMDQVFRAELARRERQELRIAEQQRWDEILRAGILVSILIIAGLLFLLAYQQVLKERQRKETAEAKLLVLRAQMNPHFMFNAVNGIQNQILKNNRIEAYGYLGKFADLLRMITKNTESTSIEVREEIRFLRTYLELEKLRFRSRFDFEVNVEDAMENCSLKIPGMMIQPFVENAIIHGLSLLPYAGKLTLSLSTVAGGVRCSVMDNGRGRRAGRERSGQQKSNHLSITYRNTEDRVTSLRENGFSPSAIVVRDLFDEDRAAGTEVILLLPYLKD